MGVTDGGGWVIDGGWRVTVSILVCQCAGGMFLPPPPPDVPGDHTGKPLEPQTILPSPPLLGTWHTNGSFAFNLRPIHCGQQMVPFGSTYLAQLPSWILVVNVRTKILYNCVFLI